MWFTKSQTCKCERAHQSAFGTLLPSRLKRRDYLRTSCGMAVAFLILISVRNVGATPSPNSARSTRDTFNDQKARTTTRNRAARAEGIKSHQGPLTIMYGGQPGVQLQVPAGR